MNKSFKLMVITPEAEFYVGNVVSLNCKTTDGWRGILPNHCAMITGIVPGVIKINEVEGKNLEATISSGILKVKDNEVIILCNSAKWNE